jgi:hypothetical protein
LGYVARAEYHEGKVLSQDQILGPRDVPLKLRGGHIVSLDFYEWLVADIREALHHLWKEGAAEPETRFKASVLLGEAAWSDLGKENS